MTPEEARAIAAELPEGGLRTAVLMSADRLERGDTSPAVLPILCSAQHPRLSPGNVCTEPAGHDGPHVATDGCGRPEYYWPRRHR